jgi:hypothetical protein
VSHLGRSALSFTAIGLAIYAGVYGVSERLLYRTGHAHPLYKIATAPEEPYDWVILGASHAMPLDFADVNAGMERDLGLRILNLASPGTGPLYNRFVLEEFLERHRARAVLYVLDSFAFSSRAWNEERFADAKLLRRTPFAWATTRRLAGYAWREGVDPRVVLDHVSGFSKVNNPERFQRDVWEGEAQFERAGKPSAAAVKKRMAYLYPEPPAAPMRDHYLGTLATLVELAQRRGMRVVAIKMPVPPQFRSQLPEEGAFDEAVVRVLGARGVPFHDFSATVGDPRLFFDTDHLNRAGVAQFLDRDLGAVLAAAGAAHDRRHRP